MEDGKVGNRVIMESERIGRPPRQGVILEVLGTGEGMHYRVRWDDGHESTFFPAAGSVTFVHKTGKASTS